MIRSPIKSFTACVLWIAITTRTSQGVIHDMIRVRMVGVTIGKAHAPFLDAGIRADRVVANLEWYFIICYLFQKRKCDVYCSFTYNMRINDLIKSSWIHTTNPHLIYCSGKPIQPDKEFSIGFILIDNIESMSSYLKCFKCQRKL